MKKSSKKNYFIKILNENFKFIKSIVLEVLQKCSNYGGMNLEMEKKCDLQHHLNHSSDIRNTSISQRCSKRSIFKYF
jgi:hypothetical protein